jgi:hypothetical protein
MSYGNDVEPTPYASASFQQEFGDGISLLGALVDLDLTSAVPTSSRAPDPAGSSGFHHQWDTAANARKPMMQPPRRKMEKVDESFHVSHTPSLSSASYAPAYESNANPPHRRENMARSLEVEDADNMYHHKKQRVMTWGMAPHAHRNAHMYPHSSYESPYRYRNTNDKERSSALPSMDPTDEHRYWSMGNSSYGYNQRPPYPVESSSYLHRATRDDTHFPIIPPHTESSRSTATASPKSSTEIRKHRYHHLHETILKTEAHCGSYHDEGDPEDDNNEGSIKSFSSFQIDRWDVRFKELVEYKKVHGDCCIPNNWKDNHPLAQWVKRQRYQYQKLKHGKPSTLTKDRQEALDELGFVWDVHGTTWDERLADLHAFRSLHGHGKVPLRYPENPALAIWAKCQRRHYKDYCDALETGKEWASATMSDERIQQLVQAGFVFCNRPSTKK